MLTITERKTRSNVDCSDEQYCGSHGMKEYLNKDFFKKNGWLIVGMWCDCWVGTFEHRATSPAACTSCLLSGRHGGLSEEKKLMWLKVQETGRIQKGASFQKEFHVVQCLKVEGLGSTRTAEREGTEQGVRPRFPSPTLKKARGMGATSRWMLGDTHTISPVYPRDKQDAAQPCRNEDRVKKWWEEAKFR